MTTDIQTATHDPLLGFAPDEIVVGPGEQTLAQAARAETSELITRAARVLRQPQHPEYLEQARVLIADAASLDDMWSAHQAAGHVLEVWVIASLAWFIRAAQR